MMQYFYRISKNLAKNFQACKIFADKVFFVRFFRDFRKNYVVCRILARFTSSANILREIKFSARFMQDKMDLSNLLKLEKKYRYFWNISPKNVWPSYHANLFHIFPGTLHVPGRRTCRTSGNWKNRDDQGSRKSSWVVMCGHKLWRGYGLQGSGENLLWSGPVWCLGMFRRVQPDRGGCLICHFYPDQSDPDCVDQQSGQI